MISLHADYRGAPDHEQNLNSGSDKERYERRDWSHKGFQERNCQDYKERKEFRSSWNKFRDSLWKELLRYTQKEVINGLLTAELLDRLLKYKTEKVGVKSGTSGTGENLPLLHVSQ